jgi:hypothetical protein
VPSLSPGSFFGLGAGKGLTISNALAKIYAELPKLPEIVHLIQFARASERGLSK